MKGLHSGTASDVSSYRGRAGEWARDWYRDGDRHWNRPLAASDGCGNNKQADQPAVAEPPLAHTCCC